MWKPRFSYMDFIFKSLVIDKECKNICELYIDNKLKLNLTAFILIDCYVILNYQTHFFDK